MTPRTVAHQAILSMGFSWQEYWSGLPFPSPGDFFLTQINQFVSTIIFPLLPAQVLGNISPRTAVACVFVSSAHSETIKLHNHFQTNKPKHILQNGWCCLCENSYQILGICSSETFRVALDLSGNGALGVFLGTASRVYASF